MAPTMPVAPPVPSPTPPNAMSMPKLDYFGSGKSGKGGECVF